MLLMQPQSWLQPGWKLKDKDEFCRKINEHSEQTTDDYKPLKKQFDLKVVKFRTQ